MTTTEPTPEAVEALDEFLAEHEYVVQQRGAVCICGFVPNVDPESLRTQQDYHREHVARAVLAAGYETPAVMKGVMACWKVDMRLAREAEDKVKRVETLANEWAADNGILTPDSRYTRDVLLHELRAALNPESGS